MFMVVKKSEKLARKIFDEKKTFNEIVPHLDKVSLDIVEVKDHHEKTLAGYNRIYYVSEGEMLLQINNNIFNIQKGDVCFVEKGMRFELEGTFRVIIVSSPSLKL